MLLIDLFTRKVYDEWENNQGVWNIHILNALENIVKNGALAYVEPMLNVPQCFRIRLLQGYGIKRCIYGVKG